MRPFNWICLHSVVILVQMTAATFIVVMFKVFCLQVGKLYLWLNKCFNTRHLHHCEWPTIRGSKQRHFKPGKYGAVSCGPGGISVRTAAVVWQDMLKTLGRRMENSLSFIPPRLPVYTASILYCTRHAVLHQPVKMLRFRMFNTHSMPSVSSSCHTKSRAVDSVKKL